MDQPTRPITVLELQEQIIALVRAFGLHRPDRTPCGQPIAVAEAHALTDLAREEPLSQRELAARLHLEKSTVSRLVDQLERRGWVERRRSPSDGRVFHLWLTPPGRKAAADLAAARQARFERLFAALPEADRAAVMDALAVLVEAMRESR